MTSPRLVFLDVDGTLIDHAQQLAPSTADAVRQARERGHLLYLCTGRARAEIPRHVRELGFDGVVSAGGGFIERGGELLAAHTMPAASVVELETFFRTHDIEYTLQALDAVYPSTGLLGRLEPMFRARGFDHTSGEGARLAERMAYRAPAPTDGIAKATFFGDHDGAFEIVRGGVGDRFHVITGTIPYLGEAGGEVSLPGMHKGAAVVELAQALGIPIAHTIAIGDSANDLEMLEVAGVGIAMGNGSAAAKAHADEVTTAVDADGVWNAFRRHGLV